MPKDLKFFMRELKEEIVTAPGPENMVDESGEPVELEIRVMTQAEIVKIQDMYRKRSIALDKRGNPYIAGGEVIFKTETDSARALRHIIAEALIYPNLKDKELMAFYKCVDVTEMPRMVFPRAAEYNHVLRVVLAAQGQAQGATDDETLEAAKN